MSLPNDIVVTLAEAKEQINQTLSLDDALIERKIISAQRYVEGMLGFELSTEFPTAGEVEYPATVPAPIKECICLLVGHWFENREASLVGVTAQALPFGLHDIISNYRRWSFGEVEDDA